MNLALSKLMHDSSSPWATIPVVVKEMFSESIKLRGLKERLPFYLKNSPSCQRKSGDDFSVRCKVINYLSLWLWWMRSKWRACLLLLKLLYPKVSSRFRTQIRRSIDLWRNSELSYSEMFMWQKVGMPRILLLRISWRR